MKKYKTSKADRSWRQRWKKNNPAKLKAWEEKYYPRKLLLKRVRKYKISENELKEFTDARQFCEICGGVPHHIDHCHTTGVIRGMLCRHCNLLIGNAFDNTQILKQAIVYLERRNKKVLETMLQLGHRIFPHLEKDAG